MSNDCFVIAHGRPLGPITIVGTWDNLDDAACYAETSIEECRTNQYSIVIVVGDHIAATIEGRFVVATGSPSDGYSLFGPFGTFIDADNFALAREGMRYSILLVYQYESSKT